MYERPENIHTSYHIKGRIPKGESIDLSLLKMNTPILLKQISFDSFLVFLYIIPHYIHRRFMTDITKYKNVTLTKETYSHIQTLSKEVFDIPISLSKTIQYLAEKELERKKRNSHGKSK